MLSDFFYVVLLTGVVRIEFKNPYFVIQGPLSSGTNPVAT